MTFLDDFDSESVLLNLKMCSIFVGSVDSFAKVEYRKKKFDSQNMKKPPQKQKFRRFRNFSFTAQQPKWQISCSKMWPIEQLYV